MNAAVCVGHRFMVWLSQWLPSAVGSTASHQVVQQPWDEFVLLHRRMKDIVPKPLSLLHRPGTALQHKRALLLPVGWKKSSFKRVAKLRMHVCEQSISAGVLLALGRGVSISKRHL